VDIGGCHLPNSSRGSPFDKEVAVVEFGNVLLEVLPMIRAIVQNGVIQPLDPLPAAWSDGREVVVESADAQTDVKSQEDDNWYHDMAELTADLNDSREWAQIEATLADADRQAKDLVRREMGLP
jgi:hypothetical protein